MNTPIEDLGEEIEGLEPDKLTVSFHSGSSIWGTDWLKVEGPAGPIVIAATKDGSHAIFLTPPEECDQPDANIRQPEDVLGWVEDHFNVQAA